MTGARIPAEVVPVSPDQAGRVAKALAGVGLRVLHVGTTSISVDAPRDVWESALAVRFTSARKRVQDVPAREESVLRAVPGSVRLPASLEDLVADVAFVEPPELH